MQTKYEIGDVVKNVITNKTFPVTRISIEKDNLTSYAGSAGVFYDENNLTLLQPVGCNFKVGALACVTNNPSCRFTIGKIERHDDGVRLYWDEASRKANPSLSTTPDEDWTFARLATLLVTDEIPPSQLLAPYADWKPGRKVRCINNNNAESLAIGETYTISVPDNSASGANRSPVRVVFGKVEVWIHPSGYWFASRFELLPEETEEVRKLKEELQKYKEANEVLANREANYKQELKIKCIHIDELRTWLDSVCSALGLPGSPSYLDLGPRIATQKKHLEDCYKVYEQLRDLLGMSSSSSGDMIVKEVRRTTKDLRELIESNKQWRELCSRAETRKMELDRAVSRRS